MVINLNLEVNGLMVRERSQKRNGDFFQIITKIEKKIQNNVKINLPLLVDLKKYLMSQR